MNQPATYDLTGLSLQDLQLLQDALLAVTHPGQDHTDPGAPDGAPGRRPAGRPRPRPGPARTAAEPHQPSPARSRPHPPHAWLYRLGERPTPADGGDTEPAAGTWSKRARQFEAHYDRLLETATSPEAALLAIIRAHSANDDLGLLRKYVTPAHRS